MSADSSDRVAAAAAAAHLHQVSAGPLYSEQRVPSFGQNRK